MRYGQQDPERHRDAVARLVRVRHRECCRVVLAVTPAVIGCLEAPEPARRSGVRIR
jgi:hypothetical protein